MPRTPPWERSTIRKVLAGEVLGLDETARVRAQRELLELVGSFLSLLQGGPIQVTDD
jgi:hypothetical protein